MASLHFFETREQKIGTLICLAAAIIFGLYPPAVKTAYDEGANVVFIVLLTVAMRFAAMVIFAAMQGHKHYFDNSRARKLSLWGGFLQAVSVVGISGGVYYLPGAIVITIMFTYSLMLLFYAAMRGAYVLNRVNVAMTFAALVGLALVLDVFRQDFSYSAIGIALSVLAAISTFLRVTIFSRQDKSRSPAIVGAETYLIAFLCLLPLIVWDWPVAPVTPYGWMMALLAGLCLALASFGIFYGIAYLGPYRFSMIAKLEPIFTALFGVLLLGEIFTLLQYTGILMVVGGLLSLQIFDRQEEKR